MRESSKVRPSQSPWPQVMRRTGNCLRQVACLPKPHRQLPRQTGLMRVRHRQRLPPNRGRRRWPQSENVDTEWIRNAPKGHDKSAQGRASRRSRRAPPWDHVHPTAVAEPVPPIRPSPSRGHYVSVSMPLGAGCWPSWLTPCPLWPSGPPLSHRSPQGLARSGKRSARAASGE